MITNAHPKQRWQGSNAAEEIVRLLPRRQAFIIAYRSLPGLKTLGDCSYEQIREHRYQWFGKRKETYYSPFGCYNNSCSILEE